MIVNRETHLVRSQFSRNRVVELDGTGLSSRFHWWNVETQNVAGDGNQPLGGGNGEHSPVSAPANSRKVIGRWRDRQRKQDVREL